MLCDSYLCHLFLLTIFPVQSFRINFLQHGCSTGHDSFRTFPHFQCGVLHRLQHGYLLQHRLFHKLQGNTFSRLVSSTDASVPGQPPPAPSLPLVFTGLFLMLLPSLLTLLCNIFYPFSNMFAQRCH